MSTQFNIYFGGHIKRMFEYLDKSLIESIIFSSNPSSSIVNDFIPYHALMSGTLLTKADSSTKALLYSFDVSNNISASKSYEQFFRYLVNADTWYRLHKKNTVVDYRCRAGQLIIVSNNTAIPLVTLVVNKQHLFDINKEQPDYSKFFIVINDKFSKEHTNIYRNFYKYYLEEASKYVDVIYTKSIFDFCYKQVPLAVPKVNTISEARNVYRDMTYNILRSISTKEYI